MHRNDRRILAGLIAVLRRVPDGRLVAVARRARLSRRTLQRIRAGQVDVRITTLTRLADALGITITIGVPRRPAPIGRRHGRPRGIRREPNHGENHEHEEDAPEREDV